MTADPLPIAAPPFESVVESRGAAKRFVSGRYLDVLLATLLGASTFLVHNVPYMFSLPFWTDEAWVAISTKLPVSQLLKVTTSTPAGWTLLLRLVFVGGDERLRIVPLLFAALTVVAAYGYVRSLPWPSTLLGRTAAVLGAVAALITPSALARDDLKQYTADAFVTMTILLLAARLESAWTRRRLIGVCVAVVLGFLFSAVSVFVGAATLGSLLLVALIRRDWLRVRDLAVAGVFAAVLLVVTFLTLYRPGLSPGLNSYWAGYYLPIGQGWGRTWRFLLAGGRSMASYIGMGPLVVVAVLVMAGVVTLARLRRPALAITVPALVGEMIVLGAAKQYPLFDLRTSHFLTTALAVTAAIGIGGGCVLLARVHVWVAILAAALAAALFVMNVKGGFRALVINTPAASVEDLRTPTDYVAAHRRPGDIIVVNMNSNWGFAYYWHQGTAAIEHVNSNLNRFITVFPDQPNVLVATDRTTSAIDAVIHQAVAAAGKSGPDARIWFVHQHTTPAELQAYTEAAKAHGLDWRQVIPGGLALLTPTT